MTPAADQPPPEAHNGGRPGPWGGALTRGALVLLALAAALGLAGASIRHKSVTFDEPAHFYSGLRFVLGLDAPTPAGIPGSLSPPAEALQTIPIVLAARLHGDSPARDLLAFVQWLSWGRAVTLACLLLLAVTVFRWSRALYGFWAALGSLVLVLFSPNLLAHSRLLTTDIPFVTCSFLWLYYLWRSWQVQWSRRNLALSALWFALALSTKYLFLAFAPACLALALLWLTRPGTSTDRRQARRRVVLHACLMAAAGLLLLNLAYRFKLGTLADLLGAGAATWAGQVPLPFPQLYLSDYHAVAGVLQRWGPIYLFGRWSSDGFGHYYLAALALKSTLPFLLLGLGGLALTLVRRDRWHLLVYLVLPPAAVVTTLSLQNCQLGVRHVLCVYPFLAVLAGGLLHHVGGRRPLGVALVALLAWHVGASVASYPHYLPYFNEAAGGPAAGHRYLLDSNLDWGQDLPGLARYARDNVQGPLQLDYFGLPVPAAMRHQIIEQIYRLPHRQVSGDACRGGLLAVSANHLWGPPGAEPYGWLRGCTPRAVIGHSIVVFRVQRQPGRGPSCAAAGH